MKREQTLPILELAFMLRDNFKLSIYATNYLMHELMGVARAADRLALMQCNEPEPSEGYFDKNKERLDKKMRSFVKEYELDGLSWSIGGDPRGYCLKLHTPNKAYNTWGGVESGWGV